MSNNHENDNNIEVVNENNMEESNTLGENNEKLSLFIFLIGFLFCAGIGNILDLLNQYGIIHIKLCQNMSITDFMVIIYIVTCLPKDSSENTKNK